MPIKSGEPLDINNRNKMDVSLITKGEPLITAKILIRCPTCHSTRKFKNTFSNDKIDLILVSVKIIDWLTCECGSLFDTEIEYEI